MFGWCGWSLGRHCGVDLQCFVFGQYPEDKRWEEALANIYFAKGMSCLLRSWHNLPVPSCNGNVWFEVNAYDYVKQKVKQKERIHQEIEWYEDTAEETCSDYSISCLSVSICVKVIRHNDKNRYQYDAVWQTNVSHKHSEKSPYHIG